MSYADVHADALADVAAAGVAVIFSAVTQTYDATTDTVTPVTTTMTGSAVQVGGDPRQFEALGLVQQRPIVLLFAPNSYGSVPALGSTVSWGGARYTVRAVQPIAPDGTAILSRVTASL